MGRTIVIANQKGGVGKTTTSINLSAALAEQGQKVLVIDMDPQGNTTSGLGVEKDEVENTVYELLLGECTIQECMQKEIFENLSILPANINLAGAEIELISAENKEYLLKNTLDEVKDQYDFIIIDCPPSLNLLTINSMCAGDTVLVPIQCEYYALEGLSQLMHTIDLVKERLNPNLEMEGVVFTMYDARTNLSLQVVESVKNNLNQKVYKSIIPRNVRLAEAPSYGMPITKYDKRSTGAESYRLLAEEVIHRGRRRMAVKKSGLGKGLDSLIAPKTRPEQKTQTTSAAVKPEKETIVKTVVKKEEVKLRISEVEPNREQPRKKFDEDALLELADSIRQFGVLQPLLVQKRDGYYEIIAGERRWRAAKMAGLKEVPVVIKDFTDQQIVEISLIENIQREDLNPIEEALAYKRLLSEFKLKQDEVAERVSKSRTAVTNSVRLLKLDRRVQQMVIDEMISTGHARALLSIEDGDQQYKIAMQVFDEKLSVREVEKLMKKLQNSNEKKEKQKPEHEFIYQDMEEKIKALLGTKVTISPKANHKGKIVIDYYSDDELERLMELFRSNSSVYRRNL